jgi:uroporphyrinogen-III synthase
MILPLAGRCVLVPEGRELDLFVQMLEERGAAVLRCPMIAIVDAPDPAPIEAWLRRFVAGGYDDLILLTGEGLRRLLGVARRAGLEGAFIAALSAPRKVTRGPKPARALREIGLKPDLAAAEPTTEGVIAALSGETLSGRRVGVQLYPDNPNLKLLDFLRGKGAAPDPVLPYAYATAADDRQVTDAIERMAAGEVDVIAFTSSPQVKRLGDVARAGGIEAKLTAALAKTRVASVGPVVADALHAAGFKVDISTSESFFMKPLVNAIADALGPR